MGVPESGTHTHTQPIFRTSSKVLSLEVAFYLSLHHLHGLSGGSVVKNPSAAQESQVQALGGEDPLEKKWQLTPVSLPGKSHGQRSLVGSSPWGHKWVKHNSATRSRQTQSQKNNQEQTCGFLKCTGFRAVVIHMFWKRCVGLLRLCPKVPPLGRSNNRLSLLAFWRPEVWEQADSRLGFFEVRTMFSGLLLGSWTAVCSLCPRVAFLLCVLTSLSCKDTGLTGSVKAKVAQSHLTLQPRGLYSPWDSPGQNTRVGSLSLLQGIFPTQVSHIAGGFFTSWATREAQEWTQRGWQKGDLKKSYLKDSDLTAKEMKDN